MQNDIITALALYIRKVIRSEIQDASIFSILLDGTTDISHTKQASFAIRFVHQMEIKEHFIGLCHVDSTTGEELEKMIMRVLSENDLKMENIYGQGYDGAANMSGHYKGLQSQFQQQNEKALYVHCQAHCLNLVLVESALSSILLATFFALVKKLYAFIANSSKQHASFVKTQKEMYPNQHPVELQRLPDIRWACREKAMKTLKKALPAVVKFLTTLIKQDPPDAVVGEAKILLHSINFEFMLCLEMTTAVFLETACASSALQKEDLDLGAAYDIVSGIVTRLRDLRTEEEFKSIYERATSHAEAASIDVPDVIPGHGRRRKIPAKLMHCSTSTTEDHESHTLE
ncbi:zinc finger MYM-type protein 1-like [Myxocyprinus asiaticus]|uniref:zinc finger MYM-type protein 1-like n=1 Tax=Myxocyprinus asiaticus TaxID=70543 RepID=UPI00222289E7|nr:zinc finger MYM-type protein 1-like [Myxocyprinus asiaticus]